MSHRMPSRGGPEVVDTSDLEADDIVIAVMGPTGSGKSTFVRAASGHGTSVVGHTPRDFRDRVSATRFWDQESGRHVVLVEFPGFDDTFRSDLEILYKTADWLVSSYNKNKLLSGILYLHRIEGNRVAGSSLKNLRVFRKLCGRDALEKVFLVTTTWDKVECSVGERRLEALKTEYWKTMISQGARIARCRGDDDSPKELIQHIVAQETPPKPLLIQLEMAEMKKELKETAAGQQLYSQLETLVEKQLQLLHRIEKEKKVADDPEILQELQTEYNDLRAQIDDKLRQMQQLKLPWLKRFLPKWEPSSYRKPDSAPRETANHQPLKRIGLSHPEIPSSFNVVIFGEAGVGKSSVVNLIADKDVAQTSGDTWGCTLESKRYSFSVGKRTFNIWDTIGLGEPSFSVTDYLGAIEKTYVLIQQIEANDGLDLLLFCIPGSGSRITNTMLCNYRLFFEVLCEKRIPISAVVTRLEYEAESMEAWWVRNRESISKSGLHFGGHACVTGRREHPKAAEGRAALELLLLGYDHKGRYPMPPASDWFSGFLKRLPSIPRSRELNNKRKELEQLLRSRCMMDSADAQQLAVNLTRSREQDP